MVASVALQRFRGVSGGQDGPYGLRMADDHRRSDDRPGPDADDAMGERQRTLLRIFANSKTALSTTDVMHLTDQSLGATAHHVRALARRGYIVWASEHRVRGATQTFYVASATGHAATRRHRFLTLMDLAEVPRQQLATMSEPAMAELGSLLDEVARRVAAIVGQP